MLLGEQFWVFLNSYYWLDSGKCSRRVSGILMLVGGAINDRRIQIINSLTLEQLDDLGEALLDFGELADLDNWLGFRIGE